MPNMVELRNQKNKQHRITAMEIENRVSIGHYEQIKPSEETIRSEVSQTEITLSKEVS